MQKLYNIYSDYKINDQGEKMKHVFFIYNPRSGRGEIAYALSDILVRFTSAG